MAADDDTIQWEGYDRVADASDAYRWLADMADISREIGQFIGCLSITQYNDL